MSQINKVTAQQARDTLWRRGSLGWLFDGNQKALYELFHKNNNKIHTWLLARRSGKTYSLCVLSIEHCIKHPKSIIKYVAPTKVQVERFIRPIIAQILETCPDDLKPEFKIKDGIYFFTNGSELQLCPAEKGNIDSIRGGFAHIAIVDEAQDVSDLKYAVNSVLLPTTLTTKGKILISGTPSKDPDHEFNHFIEMCESNGTLIKRTIYDNPRLTAQDIEQLIEAMGGEKSEDFERECLCKRIKSKIRTVIPEFDEDKAKEIVKEWPKPDFYDAYVGLDLGFKDLTVALFGYYDFKNDKIIIEDEIVTNGNEMHLNKLAHDILNKEAELWTNVLTNETLKPKKRVSDHDLIAINEMRKATSYRLNFDLADKKDKMAGINFIRTMIKANKIIINPRCKVLVRHLNAALWSGSSKDDLARSPDNGHYDAIPALSYLLRAIDFRHNPYPKDYKSPLVPGDAFYTENYNKNNGTDVYKKLLKNPALDKQENNSSWAKYFKKG